MKLEPLSATQTEVRRLAVLHGTGLLDSPNEACFDALVHCAAQLTGCTAALMTLCDADRLWVKARVGIELQQTTRHGAFCAHVVDANQVLEVRDAPNDTRFAGHPLVTGAPHVRYYAGAPLLLDGVAIGSLCVIDTAPRQLSEAQLGALQWLAKSACEILQMRQRSADSDTERRRLLDFARASGDWMWETDARLRYTWISGAYDAVIGEPSTAQLGTVLCDGPLLDGAGQALGDGSQLHDLLRAGQPFSRALIEQSGADRRLVVSLSAVPVIDADGRTTGWRGTARDVTGPIREAELQRSHNELLAQVSANMPGLIYRFRRDPDGQGRFEFVNQQVGRVLSLTPADILGEPRAIYKLVHADDVAALEHRIEEADRLQQPADLEYRVVHKDGRERWVSSHSSRRRMPDGCLVTHGFIVDITERKQIELALRESEQRWEIAANATGIGIAQLDLATGLLQFDARACASHGLQYPHPGHSLADWMDSIHPEDRDAAQAALAQALGQRGRLEARYRFCRADGTTPWLEVVAQAVHDSQGRAISMIGTCRDVTAQMAVDALRRDKESAERASRAKTEFLSRVSHELRTPLNGILGFAQLMALDRQHVLPEVQQRRLEGVERSGQHLLALVNDVLDIARIERDDFAPRLQAVDVADVIARALVSVRPLAAARGMRIDVHVPGSCWALADERSLEQVLANLLSNAIKFNRERGRVRIVADQPDAHARRLRVSVVDEGPGLSTAQQTELFQPFNRLGAERRRIDGNGLGLVIARQLALAMQGTLDVNSDGSNGCCFTLDIQGVASPHGADDDETPTQPAALVDESSSPDAPKRQVIYIEDEALNRVLMEEVFRQQTEWQLHTASDGAEGIALARELLPDLLLIDINLPDMSGLAVVQSLRSDTRTAELHCIALSADALHEQMETARNAGFDDYWTKPIDVAQLMRTLAGTLSRGRRG